MIRDLYSKLEYDESKLCLQYMCMLHVHVHVCAVFVPTVVQCTVGLRGKKRDLCYEKFKHGNPPCLFTYKARRERPNIV